MWGEQMADVQPVQGGHRVFRGRGLTGGCTSPDVVPNLWSCARYAGNTWTN